MKAISESDLSKGSMRDCHLLVVKLLGGVIQQHRRHFLDRKTLTVLREIFHVLVFPTVMGIVSDRK